MASSPAAGDNAESAAGLANHAVRPRRPWRRPVLTRPAPSMSAGPVSDHHAVAGLRLVRGSRQGRRRADGAGRAPARRLDGHENGPTIERVMVLLVELVWTGASGARAAGPPGPSRRGRWRPLRSTRGETQTLLEEMTAGGRRRAARSTNAAPVRRCATTLLRPGSSMQRGIGLCLPELAFSAEPYSGPGTSRSLPAWKGPPRGPGSCTCSGA